MEQISLLHLDDKPEDLQALQEFLQINANGIFNVVGKSSVHDALVYLEEHPDTQLCLVDFTLNAERSPGSAETWNGLLFCRAAKLISPNTNFILLTERRGASLMQSAAEVGYFGVIKKIDLNRQHPSSITDYLRYACFYSESFLKKRSDARLNFSQSIAHTLKSALLGNESFITQAINNVSAREFGQDQRLQANAALDTLAARHRETLKRIGHVLSFYTRLRLNCENACLLEEIDDLVGARPERQLIKVIRTPGDFRGSFDRVLIKLAIENLIDNSLKAVRGIEGREPQIEIRSSLIREPGGTFMFEVKVIDNGVGLKAGTEAEVNIPFFTADNLEKGIASFGIGCAETEKIAMLHRSGPTIGDLRVANREDKRGCVATLRFPRYSTPVAN